MDKQDQNTASEKNEIRLSVALVTRNRPQELHECLKSWRAQSAAPFEIVISDDSDPQHAGQIKQLATEYKCEYTTGPRRGLAANRNHAAVSCRGSHIVTGDDDHVHPTDYIERILELIASDRKRVWIFDERNPLRPEAPLKPPPELHYSSAGCSPEDPSNCAAIADGASVFPREIFDQGLRWDETYRFGPMQYLFGKLLVKKGWRISFSDRTFVWHREVLEGRESDVKALELHIESSLYVLWINALWLNPSLFNFICAKAYTWRHILFTSSVTWFKVKARLSLPAALHMTVNVFQAGPRYRRMLK